MPSISRNFLILLLASAANATPVPLVTTSATTETSCYLPDGFLIYPGEQKVVREDFSCFIYECTPEDGLETLVGDCSPPMCVDARYIDLCCLECPNGQNCRLPNGEILNGTREVEIGGMTCKCPEADEEIGRQEDRHVTAVCEPLPSLTSIFFDTTTDTDTDTDTQTVSMPEAQCQKPDGNVLYPGQEGLDRRDSHSCDYYRCSADSRLEIVTFYCSPPVCVDAQYLNSNSCCRHCPKGQNCILPNGEILEATVVREIEGMSCKCPEDALNAGPQENWYILAQCQPLPTTLVTFSDTTTDASDLPTDASDLPTDASDLPTDTSDLPTDASDLLMDLETVSESSTACQLPGGGVLYPGQHTVARDNEFSCTFYMCHSENHLESSINFCLPPMCVDPVYFSFDSCCGHCPDGQNCLLPNGDILKGTGSLEIDGMSCKCPEVDMIAGPRLNRHIEAQCQSLSSPLVTDIGTTTQDDFTPVLDCILPSGEMLPSGETIEYGTMICTCPRDPPNIPNHVVCVPNQQNSSPDVITTDLPSTVA